MRAYNRKHKPKHTVRPKWDLKFGIWLFSYRVKERKYKVLQEVLKERQNERK